ncbi:hypothetical protein DKP76_07340 [Falsochrobactrum shanghaiense]|uniref:Uncharacterized protein n=1 Tax=Falsochrobactrum shanghaiense TaxID=2201899 RepID=A0A316JEF5_9HYPH|nr:hypothetical protein DKP76_07340 [Falsochrobactrum shanghaiense]
MPEREFDTEVLVDDVRSTARAGSVEPMRRPDYRAKKHAKPQPWIRYALREAVEMTVVVAFCVAVCAVAVGVAA